MRNVIVVPVVVSVLRMNEWTEKLDITLNIGLLKKTTLLGTTRILEKVLEY